MLLPSCLGLVGIFRLAILCLGICIIHFLAMDSEKNYTMGLYGYFTIAYLFGPVAVLSLLHIVKGVSKLTILNLPFMIIFYVLFGPSVTYSLLLTNNELLVFNIVVFNISRCLETLLTIAYIAINFVYLANVPLTRECISSRQYIYSPPPNYRQPVNYNPAHTRQPINFIPTHTNQPVSYNPTHTSQPVSHLTTSSSRPISSPTPHFRNSVGYSSPNSYPPFGYSSPNSYPFFGYSYHCESVSYPSETFAIVNGVLLIVYAIYFVLFTHVIKHKSDKTNGSSYFDKLEQIKQNLFNRFLSSEEQELREPLV